MTIPKVVDRPEIQKALAWYALLAIIYSILIFVLPANQDVMGIYNLTAFQYRVILFAIALPSLLVWFAAFWSYAKLRHYARSVRGTKEEANYRQLARGCTWLAWSFPVAAIVTLFVHGLANAWSGWHGAAIVIGNYIKLLPTLVAFTMIGTAARNFLQDAKLKISLNATRGLMLLFVVLGVVYCYLIFQNVDIGSVGNSHNPYHLPVWLLVTTFVVPYLYAWFVGLLAAYEITVFSQKVSGVLYRRSLRMLVGGLVAVLASSIVVQYITGLQSSGYILLDARLLVLTIFRVIGGIGFLLLAFGADRLKKIEDI